MDGRDILIKLNDQLFAGQTTGDISFEADEIETGTKLTGKWKTFRSGELSATVDVEGLFNMNETGGTEAAFDEMKNGEEVDFFYGGETSGDTKFTGKAIITSLNISAPKNEEATASLTLRPSGEVVKGTS